MVGGPSVALVRDIQTLFDAGTVAGLSDRQLLERFTSARDGSSEAAFEVLVRRHGPMVLRVCRNVLKDWNDAEDAFQATFVILARRCASIRRRDSVESWLFGVACRVAARARVEAARRRAVERRGATEAESALGPPGDSGADDAEIGPIVLEEVRRLPEKYRAAVVLCYWQGLTQEQAAAQLNCPLGTVRSRLARARDLLRRRLLRRGVAPLAGIGASSLDVASIVAIPANVPDSWIAATMNVVRNLAAGAGSAAAGAVPGSVSVLVQSVLKRMWLMKVKTIAIALSLLAVGAAGVIVAAPHVGSDRRTSTPAREPRAEPKEARITSATTPAPTKKVQPVLRPLGNYVIDPPDMLLVEVLEALPGRPISGERLVRPDGKISLGFYGEVYVAGLTLSEAKEKIVLHLRKYVSDETLGLVELDPETAVIKKDPEGRIIVNDPRENDRVFVDVVAYNSKFYYVLGRVQSPDRFGITGHETVLDAINQAGGLAPQADPNNVVLYRPPPPGVNEPPQRLPINLEQIMMGDDPTTNYQLLPGDRLVVHPKPGAGPGDEETRMTRRTPAFHARSPHDTPGREEGRDGPATPPLGDLERRLSEVERKLDRILESLERRP
jgi:RNA polymerase sigma factor (sigma-70 family)